MLADTSSYTSNVVNIQYSSSLASGAPNNEATGTLQNRAANTKVYNINLKNTYGAGSQAGAISAYNTQQSYYGVGFYGYQDTILAQTGNQLYAKCYIQGATDFIYGQHARAWFDGCDIRVSGKGYVTANGRADSSDVSYYVINKSSVDVSGGSTAAAGSTYLGRPWTQYARVCFQKTVLGAVINSAGWAQWSSSTPNTGGVTFQEVCHQTILTHIGNTYNFGLIKDNTNPEQYGNTGTGASGTRAGFSKKLSSALTIADILGSSYKNWVDTSYLAAV